MTVRIMVMVPLLVLKFVSPTGSLTMITITRYAISSLISLFSLNAAFAIDAIRDIYEVCGVRDGA